MSIELGLLAGGIETGTNTHYAPLAALSAHYQQQQRLLPFKTLDIGMKTVRYSPLSKLEQIAVSILANCEYLLEVNCRLKPEAGLAQIWELEAFADQSVLSRTLDRLTQMNLEPLRTAETSIWQAYSQAMQHDWRGFLGLDYDLSGLPSGNGAEGSVKGYFSGKKTSRDGN
jgi:hypothetical protein